MKIDKSMRTINVGLDPNKSVELAAELNTL